VATDAAALRSACRPARRRSPNRSSASQVSTIRPLCRACAADQPPPPSLRGQDGEAASFTAGPVMLFSLLIAVLWAWSLFTHRRRDAPDAQARRRTSGRGTHAQAAPAPNAAEPGRVNAWRLPGAMNSRRAMASLRRPSLTRRTTSRSAGVRLAQPWWVVCGRRLCGWHGSPRHRG
jgi:hypothetical protein